MPIPKERLDFHAARIAAETVARMNVACPPKGTEEEQLQLTLRRFEAVRRIALEFLPQAVDEMHEAVQNLVLWG